MTVTAKANYLIYSYVYWDITTFTLGKIFIYYINKI